MKHRLLRALDETIALLRDATAAIQRDDFDEAGAKLEEARSAMAEQAKELRAA